MINIDDGFSKNSPPAVTQAPDKRQTFTKTHLAVTQVSDSMFL